MAQNEETFFSDSWNFFLKENNPLQHCTHCTYVERGSINITRQLRACCNNDAAPFSTRDERWAISKLPISEILPICSESPHISGPAYNPLGWPIFREWVVVGISFLALNRLSKVCSANFESLQTECRLGRSNVVPYVAKVVINDYSMVIKDRSMVIKDLSMGTRRAQMCLPVFNSVELQKVSCALYQRFLRKDDWNGQYVYPLALDYNRVEDEDGVTWSVVVEDVVELDDDDVEACLGLFFCFFCRGILGDHLH
ncbi:hypothetical protein NQ318_014796 [Aromia moschata]|uniref:Uncharacterized protein n=1 Tax=Aromia moschata TaxID=1265417 RepID=A0AAV8ZDX7_9CUCU|nr:hypothetical protein NQ318_014796 [Aromia moschata]